MVLDGWSDVAGRVWFEGCGRMLLVTRVLSKGCDRNGVVRDMRPERCEKEGRIG